MFYFYELYGFFKKSFALKIKECYNMSTIRQKVDIVKSSLKPNHFRRKSMAAFTGGIRRPQTQNNNGNQNQQQSQYDRLVTVLGYNTDAKRLYCEDSNGKKYEVHVNPEEVVRGDKVAATMAIDRTKTWMGHSIDKSMEKSYPVGSKLILQRSKVLKKDNGQGYASTEVQRVIGVPNPEPDKTFQGIFTMNSRTDENRLQRISRVQQWNNYGVDVNDNDGIELLRKEMNEAAENNGKKLGDFTVTIPNIGIQFRALIKTDRKNPNAEIDAEEARKNSISGFDDYIYEVVDTSVPFDWIPGPLDEAGREIKSQAHSITGDEMVAFVEQYIEYITNNPAFEQAIDQDLMKIEVCSFKSYPASNNKQLQLTWGDPRRDQYADRNPLYQLSHRKSFVDMAQSEQITGRNYAVRGIIQISPNKLEKINGKPTEVPSYWVNNLHANYTKGHVHALVKTANGAKAEPNEKLKLIVEVRAENSQTQQNTSGYQNNQSQQYVAQNTNAFTPPPISHSEEKQPPSYSRNETQFSNDSFPSDPIVDFDDDFDPFAPTTPVSQQSQPSDSQERKPLRFGKSK